MRAELPSRLLDADAWARLASVAAVDPTQCLTEFHSPSARATLADTDILLTGWDCPIVDDAVLDNAPRLRAIVHAAGTVKDHVSPACFERGLLVSTAADANAVPVAEYTLAVILLAGKSFWRSVACYASERAGIDLLTEFPEVGNYRRRVGVVGASRVGRHLLHLLRPFDLDVLVYDPWASVDDVASLGAHKVELDELLASCAVVSLHAPYLPATSGLISAGRLALMRDGATLINTARGGLVDHAALTAELMTGRLNAVLDVTEPEPLPANSPLYNLSNVVLTPHIAGAAGLELRRLGAWAVDEIARLSAGEPLAAPVMLSDLSRIA